MSMADAQLPTDTEEDRIINVVKNFVGEKLRKKGLVVPGYYNDNGNTANSDNRVSKIAATLQRVGDELELADAQFIENMCSQLQITQNTAYPMFRGISDQIFASGINWGRIVAFLTFGSSLAVHCASRQDMGYHYVDRVVDWMYVYMSTHLKPWMTQNGGWDGFLDFFRNDNHAGLNLSQNGFLMSTLAGVGLGAFLMMSFK